jgi:acetyl-CoA carboxylase biotin carboxyl carrier protein
MSESTDNTTPGGPDALQRYYELMRERDLSELEIRDGDFYLKLSRAVAAPAPMAWHPPAPVAAHAPVPGTPAAAPAVPAKPAGHPVVSPLAGVFYRSPSPSAPPFVKEGDKVAFGDVLCIIEAMKVMNEIRADRPGVLRKIVAENGKPVSAGQDLFLLDPLP